MAATKPPSMDAVSPTKVFQPTECQYYVLSPRSSIESPRRRSRNGGGGGADENADHNARRGQEPIKGGQLKSKTPSKTPSKSRTTAVGASPMSARGPARQQRGEQQRPQSARGRPSQVMACMRPATPTKTRKGGAAADPSSPTQSGPGHALQMTPERMAGALDPEDIASFASTSVYSEMTHSEMSTSSRLSQLSRKSSSKKHLSSQEMEQQKIEENKRALKKLMKRNEANSRKARLPAPKHAKSTKVTVPKEFSLSAPATPRDRSGARRDANSDYEDSVGSVSSVGSLGSAVVRPKKATPSDAGSSSSAPASPATRKETPQKSKPWRPQLTVPRGPRCSDVERRPRRSSSCPPEDCGASDSDSSVWGENLSTCSRTSSQLSPEEVAERRRQVYEATANAHRKRVKAAAAAKPAAKKKDIVESVSSVGSLGSAVVRPTKEHKPTAQKKPSSTENQPSAAADAEARAQRARETAMRKKDEEAAKQRERHSLFRPGSARGSQQTHSEAQQHSRTAAPASTASNRAAAGAASKPDAVATGEAKTPRTTSRKREGSNTPRDAGRPMSARERKPSPGFGSSASRCT